MRFSLFFSLAVLAQSCVVLAHPKNGTRAPADRVSIPSPGNDPFYTPPAGWRNAARGEILRSREVDVAYLQVLKADFQAAYQLLYRTTGATESQPETTVTTIVVPHNAKRNQLVNYLTYVDADGAQCAPSYVLREGGEFGSDVVLVYQQIFISALANEGYIINLPDHQGPNRAFAVGPLEGRMSLDSVTAALNFERLGLSKKTKVVMHGYSGGAIASGWAAAQHTSYTPDLNLVGFSMGGTPANITGTVQYLDGGLFGGFAVAGITGILYSYPKLYRYLADELTVKGRDAVEFARSNCLLSTLLRYPFSRFLSSNDFVNNGARVVYLPIVHNLIKDWVLGKDKALTPSAPVYMYHGHNDEVIPFADVQKAAQDWANNGADVHLEQFTDVYMGHLTTELLNLPGVVRFVKERMAGKPVRKGLYAEEVPTPLVKMGALSQGLQEAMNAIYDIIGREVGPGDRLFMQRIAKHANQKDLQRARLHGKTTVHTHQSNKTASH